MSSLIGKLNSNGAYLFIAVGVVWAVLGIYTGSWLVAWPAAACIVGGVLLRQMPGRKFTWSWSISAAAMGLMVSAYQVYAWAPLLGGAFSDLAGATLAGFAVFAVVHVLLAYAGSNRSSAVRSATS